MKQTEEEVVEAALHTVIEDGDRHTPELTIPGVEIENLYRVNIEYQGKPGIDEPHSDIYAALNEYELDRIHTEYEQDGRGGLVHYFAFTETDAYRSAVAVKAVVIRAGLAENDPANPLCECDGCGFICHHSMLDEEIHDPDGTRLDPDGTKPDGECPVCGALSYEVTPTTTEGAKP